MTSAVATAIAARAATATRDSRGPRLLRGGGTRRARTGASSSPTVNRELYSSTNGCPSRPSDSAYERRKPRTYVGAGRMSKRSSSSALRYFGLIFVRSSSSGKSRFWRSRASRRLEPMSNMQRDSVVVIGDEQSHAQRPRSGRLQGFGATGICTRRFRSCAEFSRATRRTRATRRHRAPRRPQQPCRARRRRGRDPATAAPRPVVASERDRATKPRPARQRESHERERRRRPGSQSRRGGARSSR